MSRLAVGTFLAFITWAGVAWTEEPCTALDLDSVEGIEHFPGDDRARGILAREGFVVLPRYQRQMFEPYIGGELPYYITVDSAHRCYHVLYEAVLQHIDHIRAFRTWRFLRDLDARLVANPGPREGPLANGHPLALAYVAVARRLLGDRAAAPTGLEDEVAAEVALIERADATAPSPLFGVSEMYTAYRPRGFYEGDERLEAWFRTATWLGRRGLRIVDARETAAAVALVRAIQGEASLREAWTRDRDLLDWLVGPADDLDVADYAAVLDAASRDATGASEDEAWLAALRARLGELPDPRINDQWLEPEAWAAYRETTKGLRLLPRRRTPDGRLLQVLMEAEPGASIPRGLYVAAAMGSSRARELLDRDERAGDARLAALSEAYAAFAASLGDTHYGATLRAAALLFDEAPHGREQEGRARQEPASVGKAKDEPVSEASDLPLLPAPWSRSTAWRDRLLTTGLASWASLRHAWTLHAKSMVLFSGATNKPPGVVEPRPAYFAALASLTETLLERVPSLRPRRRTTWEQGLAELRAAVQVRGSGAPPTSAGEWDEMLDYVAWRLQRGVERPEFWTRIEAAVTGLTEKTPDGPLDEDARSAVLAAWGHFRGSSRLTKLASLLHGLRYIAERELSGEPLLDGQVAIIREYGRTTAQLNFWEGNSWLSPRRQMGLVTDVASDPRRGVHREVAVGAPMELYVVLRMPRGGYRLHVGAVYSYYEFDAAEPLTDSAWIARVRRRATPALPAHTAAYVAALDAEDVAARVRAGEVVAETANIRDPRIGEALVAALERAEAQDTPEADRLTWLIGGVEAYAGGPLRARIVDALMRWLVHRGGGVDTSRQAADHLAWVLSRVMNVDDRPRVLDVVADPPWGAHAAAREYAIETLEHARHPLTLEEAEGLLTQDDQRARRAALHLLLKDYERRHCARRPAIMKRVLAHLEGEEDLWVLAETFDQMNWMQQTPSPALAKIAFRYVQSSHPRLRSEATILVGKTHAAPYALRLLELLEATEDPRVRGDLARAVGRCWSAREQGERVTARALTVLEDLARTHAAFESWDLRSEALGCLDGLRHIGGAEGAAALGRLARDVAIRVDIRSGAVERLGELGAFGVPHLWPLVYDEATHGGTVNGLRVRLCDEAALALDEILEDALRLGWRWRSLPLDDEELERVRTEARARGYLPPDHAVGAATAGERAR